MHGMWVALFLILPWAAEPCSITRPVSPEEIVGSRVVAHLMRILFGVQVTVADAYVPMWVSGVAFVVAGFLAIMLWRGARRNG